MLAKAGRPYKEAYDRFEEFLLGFNQSCERFVMTDVGNDDEVTVAKLKAHLDFYSRSQEIYRVVFGGCHNGAYVSQLHSLQLTSLYREKLVLLPGCTEMAPEFKNLQLPSLIIPGLFIPDKIASTTYSHADGSSVSYGPPPGLPTPSSPSQQSSTGSSTSPPPPPYPDQSESKPASDVIKARVDNSSETFLSSSQSSSSDRSHRVILGSVAGPVSYRHRWTQDHLRYPTDSSAESIESSRNGVSTAKIPGKQRKINRDIPLSQHNPPPCTLFYLAANGCKHGPDCRFGHEYILDDEDYDMLRANAKKVPCPAVNRGEPCVFGANCCYGHTCPFLTRCHYFRQSKCKFQGPNMHREEEAACV
ncbi:uncharacterized protein FOMMEDRAFT_141705 [Fomitiporia mediterranea MF3/22]|uniref:uncharacterized protein n=1 Tax=Fomitiporia mediterranea (strain MF3/22) TaxID=694068 RepID=UPI000440832F|nr:uncharacterized protein FOMMEDRAFT_141705 [Fomitiporia mediterranea MF3/22]EJD00943.1 hypothetical protein FOMMEDRAFT_141705 [Fomitiporia mediterranea MF3/22]